MPAWLPRREGADSRSPIKSPRAGSVYRHSGWGMTSPGANRGPASLCLLRGPSVWLWRYILGKVDAFFRNARTPWVSRPVAVWSSFRQSQPSLESNFPFQGLPGRLNGLPRVPFQPQLPTSFNESAPFQMYPFEKNNQPGLRNTTIKRRPRHRGTWVGIPASTPDHPCCSWSSPHPD